MNFDAVTTQNIKRNTNGNWPQTPYLPYRIFIICGSGSRRTNTLLNLVSH